MNHIAYWLDIGNNASSGQYVLGQPLNGRNRRKAERLRMVAELYPEIADTAAREDPLPSCSALEALERQEPYINQTLAASALAMLARLFRYGRLCHHGGFFNAQTGQMMALPVDPALWRRIRKSKKRDGAPRLALSRSSFRSYDIHDSMIGAEAGRGPRTSGGDTEPSGTQD